MTGNVNMPALREAADHLAGVADAASLGDVGTAACLTVPAATCASDAFGHGSPAAAAFGTVLHAVLADLGLEGRPS